MPEPSYRLVKRLRMRELMERIGTGEDITIRELAERVGCSKSTISNLLNGTQQCVPASVANAICRVIGVDLLILFNPVGRSVPVPAGEIPPQAVRAAV